MEADIRTAIVSDALIGTESAETVQHIHDGEMLQSFGSSVSLAGERRYLRCIPDGRYKRRENE